MDESRQADIKRIDERLNTRKTQTETIKHAVGRKPNGEPIIEIEQREHYDPALDKWGKDQAAKAKATILEQTKDKKLGRLRERLIRAVKAGDKRAELQITARIKHHEGKPFEDYS